MTRTCGRGHAYEITGSPSWLGGRCPTCRASAKSAWEYKDGATMAKRQSQKMDSAIRRRIARKLDLLIPDLFDRRTAALMERARDTRESANEHEKKMALDYLMRKGIV